MQNLNMQIQLIYWYYKPMHIFNVAPPHFKLKPPDTVYVKVGESVSLSCEAVGTPQPVISWFKVCKLYISYFLMHKINFFTFTYFTLKNSVYFIQ